MWPALSVLSTKPSRGGPYALHRRRLLATTAVSRRQIRRIPVTPRSLTSTTNTRVSIPFDSPMSPLRFVPVHATLRHGRISASAYALMLLLCCCYCRYVAC